MSARAWIRALAVAASATGCSRDTIALPNGAGVSLFSPDFVFACSPLHEVGCEGVFEPRVSGAHAGVPLAGEDALGARMASLHAAKHSIRIQALIFRADESGLAIADLLKAKKRVGLDVRVIVDAMSNLDWQTQWMYFDLKRHGIEVEGYEAMYMEWLTAERLLDPLRANKRFHDKMWIVDAEDPEHALAIVGGLNIANEYFRIADRSIDRWHDQDVVLRGPVVADVTAAFDRNYAFFKGIKDHRPAALNPDNAWKLSQGVLAQIESVTVPYWERDDLRAKVQACADRNVAFAFDPPTVRFLQSRPRFEETYILQAYLDLIDRAERSIRIANAYFVPSRPIVAALRRAAERGVDVVVVTNSPETNDISQVAAVSRWLYKEVMAPQGRGVSVHEWIGPAIDEGTLHAKYAIFDARAAIVGSYNLDPRSERLNSETAIAIDDPTLAQHLFEHFDREVLPKSRRIEWAEAIAFRKPEGAAAKLELIFSVPLKDWL